MQDDTQKQRCAPECLTSSSAGGGGAGGGVGGDASHPLPTARQRSGLLTRLRPHQTFIYRNKPRLLLSAMEPLAFSLILHAAEANAIASANRIRLHRQTWCFLTFPAAVARQPACPGGRRGSCVLTVMEFRARQLLGCPVPVKDAGTDPVPSFLSPQPKTPPTERLAMEQMGRIQTTSPSSWCPSSSSWACWGW